MIVGNFTGLHAWERNALLYSLFRFHAKHPWRTQWWEDRLRCYDFSNYFNALAIRSPHHFFSAKHVGLNILLLHDKKNRILQHSFPPKKSSLHTGTRIIRHHLLVSAGVFCVSALVHVQMSLCVCVCFTECLSLFHTDWRFSWQQPKQSFLH